jgi:hypothetical protein
MSNILAGMAENIKTQVDRASLVQSDWIMKNFTHPKNDRLPWSFKDHEFQIDIANLAETQRDMATIKCAQVGLTELQIRCMLAFLAQHSMLKAAYLLPTGRMSMEFTQSRFNPAMDTSPYISSVLSNDTDNTSLKRIGSCFLLLRGTKGTSSAISFDLDLIIADEVDFCDQDVLKAYTSRLQHSMLKLKRNFSTPTLPGYGISAMYDESSQAVRMVKCTHCNTWSDLNFFADVVIPGYTKPLSEFRAEDAGFEGVSSAYYMCPHCKKEITVANLNDPTKREWVDTHPGHWRKGFKVNPWDVPVYNPLNEVIESIREKTYQDWMNFRLGLPYESSENSFMRSIIERNSVATPVSLAELMGGGFYGTYIGVDLGKVAHVTVGLSRPDGLHIICAEKVHVNDLPEQHLGKYLARLAIATRCRRMVVDAAPDYSTAMYLHAVNMGYGAEYGSNTTLDIYLWDDKRGIVKIDRDAHFDDLSSWVNSSRIKFPKESKELCNHFDVVKKVRVTSGTKEVERWVSTSKADHFAHSVGYCFAAFSSLEERMSQVPLSVLPRIGGLRLKT